MKVWSSLKPVLASIRKALVSGVAAGATAYASGSPLPMAVAAGVAAGVLVWATPNRPVGA